MELKRLLQLACFANAHVVAGYSGITRRVKNVNMMDAPDIMNYLKPGELLLTTAYSIKENESELEKLVEFMAAHGCAGLGIKTKRYWDNIPNHIIEIGNRVELPIIELPLTPSLGELVNQALSCILEKETRELTDALNTQRQLTSSMLKGKGLQTIVRQLSTVLDKPVLIVDEYGDQDVSSNPPAPQISFSLKLHLLQYGQAEASYNGMGSFSFLKTANQDRQTVSIFPIPTVMPRKRYMVVFGWVSPADTTTLLVIEQSAQIIAFAYMKQHAVQERIRNTKNQFFNELLQEKIPTKQEVIRRGKEFQLHLDQDYICAVGQIDPYSLPSSSENGELFQHKTVYEHMEWRLKQAERQGIIFEAENRIGILYPLKADEQESEAAFIEILCSIQQHLLDLFGISVSFGVSPSTRDMLDIVKVYREAIDALSGGYRSKKCRFIQLYRIRQLTELLRMIPRKHLEDYYKNTLTGLVDKKGGKKEELLMTLAVYLENHCQIAKSAKQLYIHENTVKYRLQKCEKMLGRSLKEPDEMLRLRMAIVIRDLLKPS
ncbi:PucR family transcriptional regulator [Desmospora activa]|uniref:PucR family transcriptional regulator n=1 Tax=Desmospora activa DSM 45169 TaxID=1121389 RepID=A0A2T4ZBR5_9BACL|nr:PucR family transcriptional regulator [Desmospora activa]PTM59340.1 PucR family transcriptional regulator [Desmospora activa DSM 45169]